MTWEEHDFTVIIKQERYNIVFLRVILCHKNTILMTKNYQKLLRLSIENAIITKVLLKSRRYFTIAGAVFS